MKYYQHAVSVVAAIVMAATVVAIPR